MGTLNADAELRRISDNLFTSLSPLTLVDPYEAYQVLNDRWATISSDIEMLQTEGVSAANKVDPNMVIKKKDGKDTEVQDGWVGRIIPIDLVQHILLADELAKLNALQDALATTSAEIKEILDSFTDEGGQTPWLKDDGSAFVAKELKAKVKKIKKEFGSNIPSDSLEAQLVEAERLLDLEKKQKSEAKAATIALIEKAIDLIHNLSVDQIKVLLEAKWIEPLVADLYQVAQKLIDRFADGIIALSAKYADTLVDIDDKISEAEKSLAHLITDLTGSDTDVAGLREFQKLLRHE